MSDDQGATRGWPKKFADLHPTQHFLWRGEEYEFQTSARAETWTRWRPIINIIGIRVSDGVKMGMQVDANLEVWCVSKERQA